MRSTRQYIYAWDLRARTRNHMGQLISLSKWVCIPQTYAAFMLHARCMHHCTPNEVKKIKNADKADQPLLNPEGSQSIITDLQFIVGRRLIGSSLRGTVKLAGDWVCDVGELLFLLFEIFRSCGGGVLVKPFGGLLDSVEKLRNVSAYSNNLTRGYRVLTVSLSSSSILPPRPSSSLTWFLREKA